MKITHIKYKNEPYKYPLVEITTYRRNKLKLFLNYFIASLLGGLVFFILYTCITSGNDTQKLNECLQDHSLGYCNEVVK